MSYDELVQWLLSFCNDAEQVDYAARSLEGCDKPLEDIDINEVIQNSYWSEDSLFASV